MEPAVYEQRRVIHDGGLGVNPYEDRYIYLKVALCALAVAIMVALVIYFVKPNAFLKVKKDKNSGIDPGLVTLTSIGVFILTFGLVYLIYRSLSTTSPVAVAAVQPQPTYAVE